MSAPAITSVPDPLPGADLMVSPPTAWQIAQWTIPRPWKALTRMRVYGADRLPRDGAYVLASNHLAWSDPFVVGMLVAPRVLYYMAKRELWSVPVVGTLIPHTGAFPVDRGQPDREALRMARSVLENGQVLGVFVEGTRQKTGEIGNARAGASMLAMGAGVPVLPVCVRAGEGRSLPGFPPTTVAVGMPLDLSGLGKGGRAYKAGAERIEEELRRLDDFVRAAERAGRPKRAEPPR
jgi:1-acyl-sn-glycerol-3-phosphate acyltransferase